MCSTYGRMTVSVALPAGKGRTSRIGLLGKVCALATSGVAASAMSRARTSLDLAVMSSPLFELQPGFLDQLGERFVLARDDARELLGSAIDRRLAELGRY